MLEGVALCRPFAQGDLDNLCGLYAAINALCLVSAPVRPLNRREARHVLNAGMSYLQRRNWLSDAVLHGMNVQRQRAVTRHMAKAAGQIAGFKFSAVQPLPGKSKMATDAALSLIAQRVENGAAFIANLENTFWHYTVISGLSNSRIYLFDSDGLSWIERSSFGICGSQVRARHCISLASLTELSLVRREWPKGSCASY